MVFTCKHIRQCKPQTTTLNPAQSWNELGPSVRASQNVQDFLLEVRATPYYKGFNNSLYYVGGSLLYLSYKGPQNPILIIKAPTLRWNKLLASARDGVISQNLREAACASLPMCLTPPCSSGCMRVSAPRKFPKGFNSACYWSEGRRVALHAYVRSCHTFRKKPRLEFSIAGGAITRICDFGGH